MTWDAKSVEREINKALRTVALTTGKVGPKEFGNSWPEIQKEFSDLIGSKVDKKQIRIQPNAADITAADAIFEVINSLDGRARKVIYRYHLYLLVRMPKEEIAKKFGVSRRVLGRRFDQYHQELAEMFCRSDCLRRRGKVDEAPKNPVTPRGIGELRQRENQGSIQSWMEPDGRPKAEDLIEVPSQP